jgi:hypothetical protein
MLLSEQPHNFPDAPDVIRDTRFHRWAQLLKLEV